MASAGAAGQYAGDLYPINWMDTRWVTQPKPMIYAGANGPQMLQAAAGYADGIMVSDFTPARIAQVRKLIDPILQRAGKQPDSYPLNNFWAWHVKERAEDAYREARIWLCVRGTIYPDYIHDVVDESEARVVIEHLASFRNAYYSKTPEIEGVPDEIVSKIVSRGTSATSIDNIESEVRRFQEFERAGLSQIALKVYGEPEAAIRTIGEHIVPALRSTRD
jgi:alkanesulfonate monooxygenase SsuD/methylene tetrahydromethanopterin reductase-like flavin-dependent oxidoreductase (luciferase family)